MTKKQLKEKERVANAGLLGVEQDQWGVDYDPAERARFDQVLERVLAQLEPVCLSEQNFCVSFFQLDVLSPTTKVCLKINWSRFYSTILY